MSSTCVNAATLFGSPLSSKVALFNEVANKHIQSQALNPFSNDNKVGGLPRPKISKEDYGRPARGSLSEARGFKATQQVCKEMLELCEIINTQGEPLFTPEEKPDDPRIAISFGELFSIYTVINDKLVGLLLRARKYKLLDFEGECLFQRRDDHVPVILIKPMREIRDLFRSNFTPSPEPQRLREESHNEESLNEESHNEESPSEENHSEESHNEESPSEENHSEESNNEESHSEESHSEEGQSDENN